MFGEALLLLMAKPSTHFAAEVRMIFGALESVSPRGREKSHPAPAQHLLLADLLNYWLSEISHSIFKSVCFIEVKR